MSHRLCFALLGAAALPFSGSAIAQSMGPASVIHNVGQRQLPTQIAPNARPTAKISNRLQNRIQSRINNRIGRGTAVASDVISPYAAANARAPATSEPP